jgi:hypothetical protein
MSGLGSEKKTIFVVKYCTLLLLQDYFSVAAWQNFSAISTKKFGPSETIPIEAKVSKIHNAIC